jgi:hypothetical protein
MLTLLEKKNCRKASHYIYSNATNYVNDEGLIQIEKRLILLLTF